MKILALVDMHGSLRALKKAEALAHDKKPDAIVCAGDISIFEQHLEQMLAGLAKLKIPVIIVHGNHESEKSMRLACSKHKNLFFIHRKTFNFNGVLFIGWGGGGFSTRDREFEKISPLLEEKMKGYEKAVFVTHAPPYKTNLDKILEEDCGSRSFRNFIKKNSGKIKAAVSGHLHENSGKEDHIGDTRVLNPGPFGKIITI